MRKLVSCWLWIVLLTSALAPARLAQPQDAAPARVTADPVAYEITPDVEVLPPLLRVAMRFGVQGQPERVRLQMPVWSPGDYHLMNHARYVQDLRAADTQGNALAVTHPDDNTWEVAPNGAAQISVSYVLPETPPGFFSENVQLRDKLAFVNGPAAYLYLVGRKDAPATLTVHLPANWRVETPLSELPDKAADSAAFSAPDYDTLADSPVVMAAKDALVTRDFTCEGKPLRIVFFDRPERISDYDAFVPVFRRIARAESQIMQSVPFARYEFLADVGGRGGGLEHLNACRLALWSGATPRAFASFVAHEFFHLWNVKRIRPKVLGPFDYVQPPRTRNLWFAEGVTEYYAGVACLRAGLRTEEETLSEWRRSIQAMQRNPARLKVTADEASLKVWEAGNSDGYGGLSYYHKGQLIGLCLDLKIRRVTENKRSLDDVMRLLLQNHNPPQPGYEEDGILKAVNEVTGQDLTDFYNLLARSTKEMPFAQCLSYAGLDAELAPRSDATPAQVALRKSWLATNTANAQNR